MAWSQATIAPWLTWASIHLAVRPTVRIAWLSEIRALG
jgi:hypothetical protein